MLQFCCEWLNIISETLQQSEERTALFLEQLQLLYPVKFSNFTSNQIDQAYRTLLSAEMFWTDYSDINAQQVLASFKNNMSFHLPVNTSMPAKDSYSYADTTAIPFVKKSNGTIPNDYTTKRVNMKTLSSGISSHNDEPVLKIFGYLFHKISFTICIILVVWVSSVKNIFI